MRLGLDRLGTITELAGGRSWSGPELARHVRHRARRLKALGVGPGDRVMIVHGGTPAFFADLFACWEVGACAACLNPGSTPTEVRTIAEFLSPRLILAGTADANASTELPLVCLAGEESGNSGESIAEPASRLDDPALILFTSGTTGAPKGVVHSFRTLIARLVLNQAHIPSNERRKVLCPLPTHFGHGLIGNALTALLDGGDVTMIAGGNIRVAADLGNMIDQLEITFMSSVPSFWRLVLKTSKPPQKGTLCRVHVGSAPLSAALWHQIAEWSGTRNVFNMYGITETANWIGGAGASEFEPEDGLVGRVWGGQAAVLADDGTFRSHGHGEILLQTPSLMVEYLKRPDLTLQALDGGWMRTGDIGDVGTDGVIRLTGRSKHEINQAGIKVSPEEIDILVEQHPSIRDVCTFGLADDIAGEVVAVALSPADGAAFDLADLMAWVAGRLVREKQPQRWFVLAEIPRTDRGKLDRAAVIRLCTSSLSA